MEFRDWFDIKPKQWYSPQEIFSISKGISINVGLNKIKQINF